MLSLADIEQLFARHGAAQYSGEPRHAARARAADARTPPSRAGAPPRSSPPPAARPRPPAERPGRNADRCAASTTSTSTSRCRSCAGCFRDAVLDADQAARRRQALPVRRSTPGYHDALSDDSKRSLALQGGVFYAAAGAAPSSRQPRARRGDACACGTTSPSRPTLATPVARALPRPRRGLRGASPRR